MKYNINKIVKGYDLNLQNSYLEGILPPVQLGRVNFGIIGNLKEIGLISIRPLGIILEYYGASAGVSMAIVRECIEFKGMSLIKYKNNIAQKPLNIFYADKTNKALIDEYGSSDEYHAFIYTNMQLNELWSASTGQNDVNLYDAFNAVNQLGTTQNGQRSIASNILDNSRAELVINHNLKLFAEIEVVSSIKM